MCMDKIDVFISYKQTSFNYKETEDVGVSRRLCKVLEDRGLCVFFSEKTLYEKGYSKYKKAIDKALDAAQLLVVVATKQEYIESSWIEYEYETFNRAILNKKKPKGGIISYISSFKNADLPNTLGLYQSYYIDETSVEMLADFIYNSLRRNSDGEIFVGDSGICMLRDKEENRAYELFHSNYVSDYFNEQERLKIQADNSRISDNIAITYILEKCKWKKDPLYVLDVGSAYGYVSCDRFYSNKRVEKILCVDNNSRVIDRARVMFAEKEDKMIFEVADVEDENFVNTIRSLMKKHNIPKLHIVFSTLLIHHLSYPDKALRNFRKLMSNNSYILLRGSDDGSKLCYPRPELMMEIIQRGMEESGLSDRHNGSKLFSQLTNNGFKNIKVFSHMTDISTLTIEEKEILFRESFAYRLDPYRLLQEKNPDDPEIKVKFEWMKDALIRFENQFFEKDFWYCEYDYVAVGTIVPHSGKKGNQELSCKE